MSVLKLKLLGQIECVTATQSLLTLSTRKSEVLLAYLALAPGIRHPRERLINLLWSDRAEEQARNSLRQSLSSIKKSLEATTPLLLEVERTTVRVDPELVQVDALEFEQLAAKDDIDNLTRAAALYQGEFLEGITIRDAASQEWLANERERYRRIVVEVLSSLSQLQISTGEHKAAIESAERLVVHDPLHEQGWRILMRAYHEKGDRNHALLSYKRCNDVLRRELGVEPEPETMALRELIIGGNIRPENETIPAITEAPPETASPSAVGGSKDHSILVLPFDNLSDDPEQQYFSDGLTEGIIMGLSLFPDLKVHSRNSSFAAAGKNLSVKQIGQEFQSLYVVEGSVRKSSNQVRISAQLVNTDNGEQIWGKRFDNSIEETFSIEDEVTRAIVAAIKGKIDITDQDIAIRKPAKDMQSYDLLMRGKFHISRFNREDNVIGISLLLECLEKDPDNAIVHNHIYLAYVTEYLSGWHSPRSESLDNAGFHISRAMELDPDIALIQADFAEYSLFTEDWDAAELHTDRALRLNPNDPETLATAAASQAGLGNVSKAIELADTCQSIDPFHPWIDWVAGVAYYRGKRYQDALNTFKNMPNPADEIDGWIAACYQRLGDHDRASKHLDLYLEIARKNMARFPETLEEWQEFWKASPSFRPGKGVDYPFDALCDAGLRQFVEASSKNEVPSIAVLPFENMSGDPEQEYFSDGITTSIIMGLGLFTGITVKSQQTSFAFRDSPKSSEEIAEELKVDYLVEGGIRKSGDKIRVSVQLIETGSGNQIWGKQFKAELEDILELEQELSQSITGTISGRIGHKIQQSAVRKPAKNLKSYDLLLRGLYHYGKFTAGDMLTAKELMQKCIDIDPENAEAHMHLGMIHFIERLENWASDRLQSRKQSVYHCEKAIELEPDNALVQSYMAEHLISLREYERAEFHADKAIELNPNASEGYTEKAAVMGFTRRYEEAIALADHCLQLDPHSVGAGWCAGQVYRANGQYDKAIKTFRSIPNAPASIHAQIAASLAGLGRVDQAKKEMKQYQILAREQMLRYPDSREDWHLYWSEYELFQNSEDFETYFDQLLKAGLCDYLEETTDSVPSIAVLPFENMSGDPEQDYFSEGITSDIIATLSRFRGMHVIARHSTRVYKERKASLEEIAAEQQVRYILEGSIRKSGNRIRVIAELIDSHSGENCWSESYDRELDDIFAVQDEITFNITVAMKVHLNAGDRARGNASGTKSVKAWELCTQASDFEDSYIRDNINKARGLIRSALEIDPNYSFAWTTLGWLHWQEVYLAWTDSIDATLDKAENAAQKALELEPESADAWILTGSIFQARGKAQEAITACQKAVSIAPGNSEAQALTGFSLVYAGEPDKALPYYQASLRLAPNCPNWYLLLGGSIYQSKGELPKAIEIYQQAVDVEPESPLARVFLMDTLIDAGHLGKAKKIAGEIRALDDAFKVSGIIRLNSHDPIQRDRFQANMAKMGFND